MEVKNNKIVESRPLADFHPSVWGDRFLTLPVSEIKEAAINDDRQEFESLKLKVKEGLEEASTDYMRQLLMVDAIQRLGIDYHFEEEIDRALQNIYGKFSNYCSDNHDLYATSLSFRLLRQDGYKVPCDVFEKFKIPKGDFAKDDPDTKEVMGLLEFYEATHLRVHGEDILDQAFAITRDYLEAILPCLSGSSPVAEQVHHALKHYSIRRGLPRVETRHYISMYDKLYNASRDEGLLKLAKMDFNRVQSLHRKELSEMCRWWKDLEVETKLSYARDRIVETYFWITGIYFEPEYSFARKIMTRAQGILSIIDDTYDAYGTYEELKIFTEAMERWSYSCLNQLPEYMKIIYRATMELFSEIEEEMAKRGQSYRVGYGIQAMKSVWRAYLAEVKWRHEKYIPTTEEYLETAKASAGFIPLIILSLLGMGDDVVTKEAFDWIFSKPKMVEATLVICRLTDDIVGHEFEAKRDHIPSVVQCYMEEHKVTKEKAIDVFKDQIEDAWKDINEGFMRPAKFPAPILYRILNHARIMEVLYSRGDWYTHVGPEMKGFIQQLFIDPVRR